MDVLGQPINNAEPINAEEQRLRSSATLNLTEDDIALAAMTPDDSDPDTELTARVIACVDYYLTRHTDSTKENDGLYQMMIPEPLRTDRDRFFNLPPAPIAERTMANNPVLKK